MRRIRLRNPMAPWMLCRRVAAVVIGLTLINGAVSAQSKSKPIPFWDTSDESNTSQIDHSAWQEILDTYLQTPSSGINRFDYAALKASTEDTAKLAGYLSYLQGLDPRTNSRREQKAYWFNLYNSLTVQVVVEAYPVDSIKKISNSMLGGLIPVGPWGDVRAKVCGQDLTLDNIEHGILRPIYRDARIHYGVNCASLGCPNLIEKAFSAANTETLLDAGARAYVNHSRGVDFVDDDFIVISSIYTWFSEDFGDTEENVLKHLARYADEELAERLKKFEGAVDYEYDWTLNQP